jgi:hypothetical protein
MVRQPLVGLDLIFEVSILHSDTPLGMNPLIARSQRPLPDNLLYPQQTNIRVTRLVQARNSSKRAVAPPNLSTGMRLIIRGTIHLRPLFPFLAYTERN